MLLGGAAALMLVSLTACGEREKAGESSSRPPMRHTVAVVEPAAVIRHGHTSVAAKVDWTAVGRALGQAGQMQPGGVYRINLPRTDLHVTVHGVPVQPAFALTSYAAFKQTPYATMVIGDLALLDQEVPAVMARLVQRRILITALHNHMLQMSPHVMYLHYEGMGDAVQLATDIRYALKVSATPIGNASAASAARAPSINTAAIEKVLGRKGTVTNGLFTVSVPRPDTIRDMGAVIPPAMGVGMSFTFQPLGGGRAAVTGDFVLRELEVNHVLNVLVYHGIEVTALHNQALGDQPHLYYMHIWATGDATQLAQGLRAGVDQIDHLQGLNGA